MAPGRIENERSISNFEVGEHKPYIAAYTVDTAAILVATGDTMLTPDEAQRLRKKIDWHVLPLMFRGSTFIPIVRYV
jgi:hypothetical protein